MYRKATKEDLNDIYYLICDLENKLLPFDFFSKIFQSQLNNSDYYCLVYEKDNTVIGVLNLRFEKQLHHSDVIAEIMEFVVNPSYRGNGIGKILLEHALKIAVEHQSIQVEVSCNQTRIDSHRFYIREGLHNSHYKFSKSLINTDFT